MDFSYLTPPPTVSAIVHPKSYIKQIKQQKLIRRIFFNVPYDEFEIQMIDKLRNMLWQNHIDEGLSDGELLRFCYAGDLNLEKSFEKIRIYKQWMSNPKIQNGSSEATTILEEGIFYSFGRDFQFRPIIIFNIARMGDHNYTVEQYFAALNMLLKPIQQYMFVPGKVQNWIWIIDTEFKLNLPLSSASTVIEKMSAVFSSTLHKLFIVNTSALLSVAFKGIKGFIHPETLSKIEVLSSSQIKKLLNYISADELQMKFGGRVADLSVYWPTKSTNKLVFSSMTEINNTIINSQIISNEDADQQDRITEYYSLINDQQKFQEIREANNPQPCCCSASQCLLF